MPAGVPCRGGHDCYVAGARDTPRRRGNVAGQPSEQDQRIGLIESLKGIGVLFHTECNIS